MKFRINQSFSARFLSDQAGSILMMVGLSVLVLFAAGGAGYDLGHQQLVRQKIQQAADAAALAAAGMPFGSTPAQRQQTALRYFALNYPNSYLGISRPDASVQVNDEDVEVTANSVVPMSFMSNLGIATLDARGSSDAQFKVGFNKLDVIMAIDNSGSMAAQDIGSASYLEGDINAVINACKADYGSSAQIAYYGADRRNECVYPYINTMFGTYADLGAFGPTRTNAARYSANYAADKLLSNNKLGNQVATINWDNFLDNYQDFTQDYNVVRSALMRNMATGNTDSYQGLLKAQALGAAGFRANAGHILILLTDGANNVPDQNTSNSNSLAVCNTLKAQGVLIYTIAFGSGTDSVATNPVAKQFLSDCASGTNGPGQPNLNTYFWIAPDGATLQAAFTQIVATVQNLRIVH